MGKIQTRIQGNNTYYVYQETYRVKVDPGNYGKNKGSGKSKVCTRSTYLGSAEKILKCVQDKQEPLKVIVSNFGLIAAAYQTADKIKLMELLSNHIKGDRCKIPIWVYFFVTIINRLDHATSKNKMKGWLNKTILPNLMSFNLKKFTSKNFWYAADSVLSEKELILDDEDDLFAGIDETVFTKIEEKLFEKIDCLMSLSPNIICYDTTNFYTYISDPKRSKLANTCHSKASKHHLKHIGLLMAVEKKHGIPIMSRVYRANRHDSKVFSYVLADLIKSIKKVSNTNSDIIIILDKGNNSENNFKSMHGKIYWIGALVPSHYEELVDLDFSEYHGIWKGKQYYRCEKVVNGIKCAVVLTYTDATKRKQKHSLKNGIKKFKYEIINKWEGYKKIPKNIPQGIITMKKKSRYGSCLEISLINGKLVFKENEETIKERMKRFGKNIIFSNRLKSETGYLIDSYAEKNIIEDDFKILKDSTLIRFRPIRHWTDSKIRAFAFCCVISMTLIRVMQYLVEEFGYKMSPTLLKEELTDIKDVVIVYSATHAKRKITERSSVQNKLWQIFKLEEIEKRLLLHN